APLNHPLRILRVDPQCPHVAEHAWEHAKRVPRLSAVRRMAKTILRDVDLLVVRGIHTNLREVVCAFRADVVVGGARLRPRLTAVLGAIHFAADRRTPSRAATTSTTRCRERRCSRILILDNRVEDVAVREVDIEPDAPDATLGQSATELRPVRAAVGGLVD